VIIGVTKGNLAFVNCMAHWK